MTWIIFVQIVHAYVSRILTVGGFRMAKFRAGDRPGKVYPMGPSLPGDKAKAGPKKSNEILKQEFRPG